MGSDSRPTGGAALQLTVLDISQVEDRPSTLRLNDEDIDPAVAMPLVLFNPRIQLSDEISSGSEGCLSFPEITAEIDRAEAVEVEAKRWREKRSASGHRIARARIATLRLIIGMAFCLSTEWIPLRRPVSRATQASAKRDN
jgi:hypothetical protein